MDAFSPIEASKNARVCHPPTLPSSASHEWAPELTSTSRPGDQHSSIANPFEEAKPRISEFTAIEIATLQSRLEKQLGPEYLSARSGPSGQKVHYIAAEKCIALANEVFGFNGWSSAIQNIQVDFVDENPQTLKISLGLSVIVRVTLRDGTYHEDIGYGHIENCKGKAAAFEKAKKEGTTDALKRALRNFGNVLGNCIYDKDYLAKVTKIKVGPTKFDEDNLHRHTDFQKKQPAVKNDTRGPTEQKPVNNAAPPPRPAGMLPLSTKFYWAYLTDSCHSEPMDSLDKTLDDDFGDFDMADFGVTEDGHPDEVILPASHGMGNKASTMGAAGQSNPMQPPTRTIGRALSNGPPPRPQPQTPQQAQQRPAGPVHGRPNPPPNTRTSAPGGGAPAQVHQSRNNTPPPAGEQPPGPIAFFSARAVQQLPEDAPPGTASVGTDGAKLFDPHADSPSIRKTPGIDHKTSKPVGRNGQHVAPTRRDDESVPPVNLANGRPSLGHATNPSLANARQIGAPGGMSPRGNRGQFRPLSVKRPAEGGGRPPLNEMSTNNNASADATAEAKRQKTSS